jgi:hypothetical protein
MPRTGWKTSLSVRNERASAHEEPLPVMKESPKKSPRAVKKGAGASKGLGKRSVEADGRRFAVSRGGKVRR